MLACLVSKGHGVRIVCREFLKRKKNGGAPHLQVDDLIIFIYNFYFYDIHNLHWTSISHVYSYCARTQVILCELCCLVLTFHAGSEVKVLDTI